MLTLKRVSKIYRTSEVETSALTNIDLHVAEGEFVAIMGPSGCGKSTLLNLLGLLDIPTSGIYEFFGDDVSGQSENRLTKLRREKIGFIFQSFNLIEDLNVERNVEVGLLYRRVPAADRKARVQLALETVGLAHRGRHLPHQLSGGQQQRVAVARALVSKPSLILADEPTGNLDTQNGQEVMALLTKAADAGVTVIMVTHSPTHAAFARRVVRLLDGMISEDTSSVL